MTSPLWRHPVTWRHRVHAQSIAHVQFPIGCPLEPSRYLASFPRYLAPKLWQRLLRDDVINGRHLRFDATGSRSIRSAVPEISTLGSNTKWIRRSVAEVWKNSIYLELWQVFHQIYSVYRRGFKPHILQVLLKQHVVQQIQQFKL